IRFIVSAFGDCNRLFEELVEDCPCSMFLLCSKEGPSDLAEDLGFSQHHGLKTCFHTVQMVDGFVRILHIRDTFHFIKLETVPVREEFLVIVFARMHLVTDHIQFSTVACRKQHSFKYAFLFSSSMECRDDFLILKSHQFSFFDTRFSVIQTQRNNVHPNCPPIPIAPSRVPDTTSTT